MHFYIIMKLNAFQPFTRYNKYIFIFCTFHVSIIKTPYLASPICQMKWILIESLTYHSYKIPFLIP